MSIKEILLVLAKKLLYFLKSSITGKVVGPNQPTLENLFVVKVSRWIEALLFSNFIYNKVGLILSNLTFYLVKRKCRRVVLLL